MNSEFIIFTVPPLQDTRGALPNLLEAPLKFRFIRFIIVKNEVIKNFGLSICNKLDILESTRVRFEFVILKIFVILENVRVYIPKAEY